MPKDIGAASTVHLVFFGDGTHSEGDTDTAHLTLGVLTHKSPSMGEISERLAASSSRTKEYPSLKKVSALACL
jgi:hypothetical protein